MDADYITPPKDGLVTYGPEVVEEVRREFNFHNKVDREKAIAIMYQWLVTQEHIIKKDFSKGYIERCIITSKGSIERAKKQIDRMCTVKTLMPKYFQTVNMKESEIIRGLHKAHFTIMPKLTKEYYRVVLVKVKPNTTIHATDITIFYKILAITAEYLKNNDYCRGYILIGDIFDGNTGDILSKINLVELQQFIPIITEGYGCKIKGIFFVTASKFIETFIRLVKPVFTEKIGSRIHAVTTRNSLQDLIHGDVLPEEYGGTEKPLEELHEDFVEVLSAKPMQELLKEMNEACTDESKRQIDKFNEEYMGMPGTFRTLSLD